MGQLELRGSCPRIWTAALDLHCVWVEGKLSAKGKIEEAHWSFTQMPKWFSRAEFFH